MYVCLLSRQVNRILFRSELFYYNETETEGVRVSL